MGHYINPESMTKEMWLIAHGVRQPDAPPWDETLENIPVVLVDNGAFTAAAVAYSKDELTYFSRPDPRAKMWYMVPRARILEQLPQLEKRLTISAA